MPFRAWIFAAALGLIAALGQAQEQTQSPGGQAEQEQSPAKALPLPFPVEIIEDQSAANSRQRSEEEARQREIDDLIAQQGMNAATQAMNDATQRMAEYAFWSTVLVAAGTALLVITLLLTSQANRAAVAAVEVTRAIGEAQTRAYLALPFRPNWTNFSRAKIPKSGFIVDNFGQTPAYNVKIASSLEMRDRFTDKLAIIGRLGQVSFRDLAETIPPRTPELSGTDPDGASRGRFRVPANMQHPISDADFNELVSPTGSRRIYLFIKIAYDDVFRRAHQTSRVFSYRHLPEQGWDEVYQEHT